ncbi:aldo/keto reductase [Acanthopleuribacter pedis]|uniref:Aldo/keto reductase n=1 Tax=Acanthopleuribacter pedis TaxID=442870 RepID=A0A8J7U339_9BACT|nr:aldo/keto reductase [Acanthopleuribacter pedis]MBO1318389.1 aldo/keto reductase [Acanthopleuribacter pedis]
MTTESTIKPMIEPSISLGRSDLTLSAMGLGCMGMSEFYGPSDEAESIRTLHAALAMGVNFFDTADIYGPHTNETLLGRAFADRWDQLVLATKFGIVRGEDRNFRGFNGRPGYVAQACEASLKRLGRQHIDLYYMHRKDPEVPIEETVGAMKGLVEAGKVRYLGLSEVTPDDLRRAHAVHPISALQTEYSLWSREPEAELFEVCAELGITFVAYSPLGRGFLTGKIPNRESLSEDDWRRTNPRFQEETMAANQRFVALLEELAAEKEATAAQIALAWVHSQNSSLVTIPGTRKITRLAENLGALQIAFSDEEEARIRAALPEQTAGARY